MKRKFQKIILPTLILLMFSAFTVSFAQTSGDYAVLAPLPGINSTTNLPTYLPAAFKLAIGIAAGLAFVMITFGGVMYATSDAISGKSEGRKYVEDALVGLLVVIGAWVILNTINPQILNFDLSIKRPNIAPGVPTVITGIPMSEGSILDSYAVQKRISDATGRRVAPYAGPCKNGQTIGCVNLNGLPETAILGLIDLDEACGGCGINITGGTEGGHATHGAGAPIVDLRKSDGLTRFITTKKTRGPISDPKLGTYYVVNIAGKDVRFLDEKPGATGATTGAHWHVNF